MKCIRMTTTRKSIDKNCKYTGMWGTVKQNIRSSTKMQTTRNERVMNIWIIDEDVERWWVALYYYGSLYPLIGLRN